jgi:hypothetical protein
MKSTLYAGAANGIKSLAFMGSQYPVEHLNV